MGRSHGKREPGVQEITETLLQEDRQGGSSEQDSHTQEKSS